MKHTRIALAAMLVSACAANAMAQSSNSVVLYGIADAYVGARSQYQYSGYDTATGQFIASKTNQAVVDSGGLNQSRIGIRVREDLGNGLNAFARFEQGINLDAGTNAGAARESVVGLQSADWGSLSLGRQATAYHDLHSDFDVQNDDRFSAINGLPIDPATMVQVAAFRQCEAEGAACTGNTGSGGNGSVLNNTIAAINGGGYAGRYGAFVGYQKRFNNSVRYDSPNINGFSAAASVGVGENKTAASKAAVSGAVSVRYEQGPLRLGFAYQIDQTQAPALIILPGSNTPVGIAPVGSTVKLSNTLFTGAYDFGVVRVHAGFNVAKYNMTGVSRQKEAFIGAVIPLGQFTLLGQYARSTGNSLNDASSFAVEGQYSLSKRSTMYAAYNRSKLPAYTNSAFGLGMRHVF